MQLLAREQYMAADIAGWLSGRDKRLPHILTVASQWQAIEPQSVAFLL